MWKRILICCVAALEVLSAVTLLHELADVLQGAVKFVESIKFAELEL